MSEFSKFGKKKLAFALACASVLGGKTSAMNNKINANKTGVKNSQTLGAVGGAAFGSINRNNSNNNKVIDWVKNNKALTATIVTLVLGAGAAGLFLGLRSGNKKDNKQDEIRKQYFDIYKKILNFYLSNNESLDGIIEKNEGDLHRNNLLLVLEGMQVFSDFKNNETVFPLIEDIKLKVKFNISEDKKILHLEIEEKNVENQNVKNYVLDLKIPENEVIKSDDNAVRCQILFWCKDFFDFKLKNSKVILSPESPRDEVNCLITNIRDIAVGGMTKNWTGERVGGGVVNNKQAKKVRTFVSVSEDFKTCVMQDTFYEDGECKNAIGSNEWEFDIKLKENKTELKEDTKDNKKKKSIKN